MSVAPAVTRPSRAASALLGLVAVLGLAGCMGGDDGSAYRPPQGPAEATAKVEAGNTFFEPKTVRLPAGIDRIEMVGTGGVHTLVIEGVKDLKLRVDGDETDATKVRLDPGRYTYFCDLPGHRDAGMEGTIRVS